ncbi:MAG: hypothetical protein A3F10_06995 [Coxiella sp. RIFCSPHIGHO2_12_FULL_42_15]|nr:MAG: hypothetical protein A3F10_06995 [Coxiella sp. RIFCSPHIGHO2_12_FULL_42_15]
MDKKSTFSDRLNLLLDLNHFPKKGKGRQNALADLLNVSQIAARKWLENEGTPKTARIIEIARKFNANMDWLMSGTGEPLLSGMNSKLLRKEVIENQFSTPEPTQIHWVPVIKWSSIEASAEKITPGHLENTGFVPIPISKCTRNSYALVVTGESMTSPHGHEHSFLPGQIIVINPLKQPKSGDFVIAKPDDHKEAVFKQFIIEGSALFLKPLNPRYPITELKDQNQIIGAVTYQLSDYF